jgi:uncharacterized membrane protein YdjX (TVP38/TMEM64 family)
MDAKAASSVVVSALLLAGVLTLFFFGQSWLHLEEGELNRLLRDAAASPWAAPIVVSIFILLALTGFPQILLITATVLAFGGRAGALYSWLATMISATFTFALGHWFGGRWVERIGGERMKVLIEFVGRHGIAASGLIRVVPSAPFILVNAAAGAAHIPLWKYWAGTSVGIVPKILLVVALGRLAPDRRSLSDDFEGLVDFIFRRRPEDFALLVVLIGAWLAFLLVVRAVYESMRRRDARLSNPLPPGP